jgi:hypothetical protein
MINNILIVDKIMGSFQCCEAERPKPKQPDIDTKLGLYEFTFPVGQEE